MVSINSAASKFRLFPLIAKRMTTRAKVNPLTTSDVGQLPRWDLSNVYAGLETDSLRKAISDLGVQVDALDEYLDRQQDI